MIYIFLMKSQSDLSSRCTIYYISSTICFEEKASGIKKTVVSQLLVQPPCLCCSSDQKQSNSLRLLQGCSNMSWQSLCLCWQWCRAGPTGTTAEHQCQKPRWYHTLERKTVIVFRWGLNYSVGPFWIKNKSFKYSCYNKSIIKVNRILCNMLLNGAEWLFFPPIYFTAKKNLRKCYG